MNILDLDDSDDRLIGRCLRRQAEKIPDDSYLVWNDSRYSFGEVNRFANSCARAYGELGIGRGDTVSFLMETDPEWVWNTIGLNKLGAIWVPTNVDYKGAWLRESLEDGGARVLVADAALLPRVAELGAHPFERIIVRGDASGIDLGVPMIPIEELRQAPADEPDDCELDYGDTTAILWTSGTTGRSKGVMQSHNSWLRGVIDGASKDDLREGDVYYNCLPMYQSAAWVACVYRSLFTGVPCAMDARFSASEFWDRTRFYGATHVFTLGAMHIFLWKAPERPDDADNPVRVAGMSPMPDEILPHFKKRFAIEEIGQGFGQSEVMGLISRRPGESYKTNALGRVHDGIQMALLDDADLPVAVGEVGEFCARPEVPHALFNGYFRNPEATVRAWRNLWYHTGDLGRQDEDGEYYFVDRKSDFIRFKGRNVSSFAVEAAVGAHPEVLQCAAHGVVSEDLASEAELKVCVVLAPGSSIAAEALARFVNDTAPYFFVPRYIEILESLPSTPTGRVQKYKLRERGVTPQTWDAKASGFEIER